VFDCVYLLNTLETQRYGQYEHKNSRIIYNAKTDGKTRTTINRAIPNSVDASPYLPMSTQAASGAQSSSCMNFDMVYVVYEYKERNRTETGE
jgi:hypothetical protein